MIRIALIGDRNPDVTAHRAIPLALQLAATDRCVRVEPVWIGTDQLHATAQLADYQGLWSVPASPYRSIEGALLAIRYAREHRIPFLGTCGGFQHAVIEYARNVLGWQDAQHAEISPPWSSRRHPYGC